MASDGVALSSGKEDHDSLSSVSEEPPRAPDAAPAPEADTKPESAYFDGGDYLKKHSSRPSRPVVAVAAAPPPALSAPREVVDPLAVVVSGFTWWTTDAEVEALLQGEGQVDTASLGAPFAFVCDPLNGKSTGKVVLRFKTQTSADACKAQLAGKSLHGRELKVSALRHKVIAPKAAAPAAEPSRPAATAAPTSTRAAAPPATSRGGKGALSGGWAAPGGGWQGPYGPPPMGWGGPMAMPPWGGAMPPWGAYPGPGAVGRGDRDDRGKRSDRRSDSDEDRKKRHHRERDDKDHKSRRQRRSRSRS